MSDQDQSVEQGGQAIQAGGNVTISGMSSEQMVEIMTKVVQLNVQYQYEALALVEERMDEMREDLLQAFSEGRADPEALRDPDFQHTIGDAQEAYSRSGDSSVKATLVDIISRRSKAETQSREALALNTAAATAPKLTRNEFAVLSLSYLCKHTRQLYLPNGAALDALINETFVPFMDDIPDAASSFRHIEATGCGATGIGGSDLRNILVGNYGGLIAKGFALESVEDINQLVDLQSSQILIPCFRDSSKLQANGLNKSHFLEIHVDKGLSETQLIKVWKQHENSIPIRGGLVEMLQDSVPRIAELFRVWDDTLMSNLRLNTVGIAIGHANAVKEIEFDAPLSIWIQ